MTETTTDTVETCRNGHAWTEENTLRRVSSGKAIRQCRACARAAAAARKARTGAADALSTAVPEDVGAS